MDKVFFILEFYLNLLFIVSFFIKVCYNPTITNVSLELYYFIVRKEVY